jgi:alcohol dehydrogenase class IV
MTLSIGRVQSPRIIRIGGGVVRETADVMAQLGVVRPLIVTDKTLLALGHVQTLTDVLAQAGLKWGIFD